MTVVVATDLESGGTWAGATEALKKGSGRVAVWTGDGAGPGNEALIRLGATPLRSTDELLNSEPPATSKPSEQLGLLDSA